jgi:GNAT superfamily N-acetyltransferase
MASTIARSPAIIRSADRGECSEIVAVMVAANAEYRPLVPPAIFDACMADLHGLAQRWDEGEVAVAERDDRIVGAVTFYGDASDQGWGIPRGWAGFRTLAVHPAARGLGLGRQLAAWCVARACHNGAPTVCIHTAEFQSTAHRIYENMGFRRCPQYDFDAALALGATAALDSVPILAYRLDLEEREPDHDG